MGLIKLFKRKIQKDNNGAMPWYLTLGVLGSPVLAIAGIWAYYTESTSTISIAGYELTYLQVFGIVAIAIIFILLAFRDD